MMIDPKTLAAMLREIVREEVAAALARRFPPPNSVFTSGTVGMTHGLPVGVPSPASPGMVHALLPCSICGAPNGQPYAGCPWAGVDA